MAPEQTSMTGSYQDAPCFKLTQSMPDSQVLCRLSPVVEEQITGPPVEYGLKMCSA